MVKLPPHVIAASRAKDAARKFMPYLGSYLEGIPTTFTAEVETMAVDDCGRLYINPDWASQWSDDQNGWCLLHEVSHNFLDHAERRRALIPTPNEDQLEAWNIAADIAIQQMLVQFDQHRPQDTWSLKLAMERYPGIVANMSTERMYGIIYTARQGKGRGPGGQPGNQPSQNPPGNGSGPPGNLPGQNPPGNGSGKPGKQPHGKSGSASDGMNQPYELNKDLASVGANMQRMQEAADAMDADPSSTRGVGGGMMRRAINVKLRRQPDPFEQLKAIVGRSTASPMGAPEPSYRKRNRRQECDDLPLRGEFKFMPECVIIVDTSGSMGSGPKSDRVARAMTAVAQGLRKVHRPRVIAWDGRLQEDKRIGNLKQFQWVGGGGTSMEAAVEYADTKYKPEAIVLVTDGETAYPDKPTRGRLIVALVDGSTRGSVPRWAKFVDLTKEAPRHVG